MSRINKRSETSILQSLGFPCGRADCFEEQLLKLVHGNEHILILAYTT